MASSSSIRTTFATVPVTVSMGVSEWTPNHTIELLLQQADEPLPRQEQRKKLRRSVFFTKSVCRPCSAHDSIEELRQSRFTGP